MNDASGATEADPDRLADDEVVPFRVETRLSALERCDITVVGELDLATAPLLESEVLRALDGESIRQVAINLTETSFIDTTALNVFLAAAKLVEERNGSFKITGVRSHARKIFEITGLDRVLNVVPVSDLG